MFYPKICSFQSKQTDLSSIQDNLVRNPKSSTDKSAWFSQKQGSHKRHNYAHDANDFK